MVQRVVQLETPQCPPAQSSCQGSHSVPQEVTLMAHRAQHPRPCLVTGGLLTPHPGQPEPAKSITRYVAPHGLSRPRHALCAALRACPSSGESSGVLMQGTGPHHKI